MASADAPIPVQDVVQLVRQRSDTSQDGTVHGWASFPIYRQFQLDGRTTASTNATGSVTTALGYYKQLDIYIRVSFATGTTITFDALVDSRLDGTNWINLAKINQLSGTDDRVLRLSKLVAIGTADVGLNADAGAGTTRSVGWGNDLRVRTTIGGTSPQFSYTIWVNANG